MPKRIKKPLVKPETRRQWLRRFEEDGESPPQIAKADGYDVRTVRKQIEMAKQEREAREARSVVLRQALEKHYADLVAFAQKLDHDLRTPAGIPLPQKGDRMWTALREHLPRSPIWKGLNRLEHLYNEESRLEKEAENRLFGEVESAGSFEFRQEPRKVGLHADGLTSAILYRLRLMAQIHDKPFPIEKIDATPTSEGLTQISYGGWACASVSSSQEDEAKAFVASLLNGVSGWTEPEGMRRVLSERAKVTEMLSEELATIILRRVVPGRCRYCPIQNGSHREPKEVNDEGSSLR